MSPDQKTLSPMKPSPAFLLYRHVARRARLTVVGLLAVSFAVAQTTPPAPNSPKASASDESIVLSPFIVSSEQDTGYAATDSLAGTRLRTPLKDIAASLSVITKDF